MEWKVRRFVTPELRLLWGIVRESASRTCISVDRMIVEHIQETATPWSRRRGETGGLWFMVLCWCNVLCTQHVKSQTRLFRQAAILVSLQTRL